MTDPNAKTPPEEGEFARLLAEGAATKSYQVGQTVRGQVVHIGSADVFLDVGAKTEATMALAELTDDQGNLTVKQGDMVEGTVMSVTADGILVSRKITRGAQALAVLDTAFKAGLPVQGRVAKVIKGGFEVTIGGLRAFCPLSQIDLRRASEPASYVGQTLEFRIIELKEKGRSVVLSRRTLLEEQATAAAEETWKMVVPGALMTGKVTSLADFGAFVDLGGVQGLIHISEISYERVENPGDRLKPGQEVTVKVLRVDALKKRISLSLKALSEDPWEAVAARLSPGDTVRGRLMRVADFGAFIEMAPGVDGLVHVSAATPQLISEWRQIVSSHPEVEVRVLQVDLERRRISLAPVF